MDRFLIKWYFYYRKGGKFYMVPQKSRINLARHSKSLSKSDFPFWNYHFFSFIYCMVWLWQRFWVPVEIFFWIFEVPYKISHLFDNKNTIWLKIYPCFRSQITTCNFPTWPGTPCRYSLVFQHIDSQAYKYRYTTSKGCFELMTPLDHSVFWSKGGD